MTKLNTYLTSRQHEEASTHKSVFGGEFAPSSGSRTCRWEA